MNKQRIFLSLITLLLSIPLLFAARLDAECGKWKFTMSRDKLLKITLSGETILSGVYMTAWDADDSNLESRYYTTVTKTEENVTDAFGTGRRITWTYTTEGKPTLRQMVSVYPSRPYITIEGAVVATSGIVSTRQICPIVVNTTHTLPLETSENRIYDMPFANDNWATFTSTKWSDGGPVTSCEATALFNVESRRGIVIGSIDHSVWKSCVTVMPETKNRLRQLICQAGYVSPRTWDNGDFGNHTPIHKHGAVRGSTVLSPRFMLGVFDDWRTGLETYGEANTVLCPKLPFPTGDKALFGWQSWGGQEAQLNYTSAMSVLDFFEKELKPLDFAGPDGVCWMILDSFWDNMSREQRRDFARRCKALGYRPGIYTTPFSLWCDTDDEIGDYPFETVDGTSYSRKDVVLTAGGKPRKINAYSLDPTHPAVKEWNRKRFQEFVEDGFEFVKIDFMNNGSQEADRWHAPHITTGMMAYNYGMAYILEMAGNMVVDYSIAPVFPAKAHIRRIGCDAWGELPQSMYTLGCIEGSWWLDRCYSFNDPDHMTLSKVFTGKGAADENEARIRYTCGLITGMTLLGGTYAYQGEAMPYKGEKVPIVGTDAERACVVRFARNKDLTEVGRIGRTFRPVEGTFAHSATLFHPNDVSAGNEFVCDTDDAFYYVVFNYNTEKPLAQTPAFERLGINPKQFVRVAELYTGSVHSPADFKVNIPPKDVRIYRFERSGYSGVKSVAGQASWLPEIENRNDSIRLLECTYNNAVLQHCEQIDEKANWSVHTEEERTDKGKTHVFTFTAKRNMENAGVAVVFDYYRWTSDNYVMIPSSVYNGNRQRIVNRSYATGLDGTDYYRKDLALTSNPIPQLSPDFGARSRLEVNVSNAATPAMVILERAEQRGSILLTDQGIDWNNQVLDHGLIVEESLDRSVASFVISAPGVRERKPEFIGFSQSPDRGIQVKKGDQIVIRVTEISFSCKDVPTLLSHFMECRKLHIQGEAPRNLMPMSEVLARMVKNIDDRYHVGEQGEYYCPEHADWMSYGWIGGLMNTYPMLALGDAEHLQKVKHTFNFALPRGRGESGYYHDVVGADGKVFLRDAAVYHPEVGLTRRNGDVLYWMVKQFMLLKEQGKATDIDAEWEKNIRLLADAFVQTWKKHGTWGNYVNVETGDVAVYNTTSGAMAVAGLALAADYYHNPEYLQVACEAAKKFYDDFAIVGFTSGGCGDILQNADSETAIALTTSLMTLYEATGKDIYLHQSADLAHLCATWTVSFSYRLPQETPLAQLGTNLTGAVWASTQNKHGAPGFCTQSGDALFKLYRSTGNELYAELLRDVIHAHAEGIQPNGKITERLTYCNADSRGQRGDGGQTGWNETNGAMMALEIPGIYVRTDKGAVYVFDHVEATIVKQNKKQITLQINNPTAYDAVVTILAENAEEATLPLGENAFLNWNHKVEVKAGESVNYNLKKTN